MRYYYTDPLAAAWMANHFGMKFTIGTDDETLEWKHFANFPCHMPNWALYIHSDSLHLLEPQAEDVCEGLYTGEGRESHLTFTYWDTVENIKMGNLQAILPKRQVRIGKIIQRNGIPFMWPEVD